MALTLNGSGITSANIVDSAITSSKIADGTITNTDISASANIPASKLSGTGKVLQMQYTSQISNTTTTSTTKVKIISVTITPQYSTSKLKLTLHADSQQNSGNDAHIWLGRDDGSGLYNAIDDSTWASTATNDQKMWQYYYIGAVGNAVRDNSQTWVCDAKVASAITFEVWIGVVGSGSLSIGPNNPRQQLIVEEIAQ